MGAIGNSYLVLYNLSQFAGWAFLLAQLVPQLSTILTQGSDKGQLYAATGTVLIYLCLAALLEVVHAAVGLVRSSPVVTFFQVFVRIVATCLVLGYVPEAQKCIGYPFLLLAFCSVEVIRYPYYAAGILGFNLYPLLWLRYFHLFVIYYIVRDYYRLLYFSGTPPSSCCIPSERLVNWHAITTVYPDCIRRAFTA
jgi:very-long-chain (3R)-3-hydroxyacyl-CoA dehydratase